MDESLRWLNVYLVVDGEGSHVRFEITDLITMQVSYVDLSLEDAKDLAKTLERL